MGAFLGLGFGLAWMAKDLNKNSGMMRFGTFASSEQEQKEQERMARDSSKRLE